VLVGFPRQLEILSTAVLSHGVVKGNGKAFYNRYPATYLHVNALKFKI